MKLYLSSYGLGNQSKEIVKLASPGKRVALILNACDHNQSVRDKFLANQTQEITSLGLMIEELDLRKYFGRPDELEKYLKEIDLIWVNGGNTFILRRAMRESGFDTIIEQLLKNDAIVYGGFSAGAVVLHKDLHGLDITDNPHVIPAGYNSDIIWEGLGLIDFSIAVHYQSDHPESYLTDQEIEFYKSRNLPYMTLRDGEIIIITGNEIKVFG